MEEKVYKQSPFANPATSPIFYPVMPIQDYGLYMINRNRSWKKHSRRFKTNNRSNKHF